MQPHRWQPTRLLHPWDSPGKNIGVGCHFLLQCMHACMLSLFNHVRLCDPMDSSPPSSSVHRILQARILEWVAISFYPRDSGRWLISLPFPVTRGHLHSLVMASSRRESKSLCASLCPLFFLSLSIPSLSRSLFLFASIITPLCLIVWLSLFYSPIINNRQLHLYHLDNLPIRRSLT